MITILAAASETEGLFGRPGRFKRSVGAGAADVGKRMGITCDLQRFVVDGALNRRKLP